VYGERQPGHLGRYLDKAVAWALPEEELEDLQRDCLVKQSGNKWPYPTVYDVTYSYTGFQAAQGDDSFPGTQLDADLAALQASTEDVVEFIGGVMRSDGALQNGIVTYDSLSPDLQTAGLAPAAAWVTATEYAADANVIHDYGLYRAEVAHLSNVFATDLAAGRWVLVTTFPSVAYLAGSGLLLTTLTFSVSGLTTAHFAANIVDTDATLAANSDARIPSQKAVKAYADQVIAAADAMVFKGVIDCSANPDYPAADRGWTYKISVAGKIGGASGTNVEVGDTLYCITDGTVAGDQAAVGAQWQIVQANLDGAVIGPASVTDDLPAVFDGVSGKLLKSKTYAAFKTLLALVKGDVGLGSVQDVVVQYGQCILAKSGSNLVLSPKNGNLLTVNGVACTVPDAGVSLAPGVLTPGTLYYIYAVATAGAVSSLEASATAYAVSTTAGNKGVVIKNGDDTRTLVGMARPITGPAWSDLINQRFVRSWFNEAGVSVTASLTADRTVTSLALTYAEIHSEMRVEALSWAGETWDLALGGSVFNSNTGQSVFTAVGFDGVTAESPASTQVMANGNAYQSVGFRVAKAGLSEGYHYGTGLGAVTANTGQWRGVNTPTGIAGRVGR